MAADGPVPFERVVRGGAALGRTAATAVAAFGATTRLSEVDCGSFVVRAAGVRATFLGTLVTDYARRIAVFGLVALVTLASVAVGRGGAGSLPTGALAVGCVLLTAELAGHVLGLSWVHVAGRVPLLVRIVGGGSALAVAALAIERLPLLLAVAARTPLAAFGDLFLLGTPFPADERRAALAVAGTPLVSPLAYLLAERLARDVWFRDPPAGDDVGARGARLVDTLLAAVAGLVGYRFAAGRFATLAPD